MICPYCGSLNDLADEISDPHAVAEEGDLSMCYICGGLGIYTKDAQDIRIPSLEEFAEFLEHPEVVRSIWTRYVAMSTGDYKPADAIKHLRSAGGTFGS